jgi:ArsR family transcriptional regulator, arsenate/arsenite/antimonite-responsive transcriptional repressor
VELVAALLGSEACVCGLTVGFDLTGPTISHHLKVLREAGLIALNAQAFPFSRSSYIVDKR